MNASHSENNFNTDDHQHIIDNNELACFDGKKHLEIFQIYMKMTEDYQEKIKKLIENKKKNNISDDEDMIVGYIEEIKRIRHNLYYNTYYLNKISNKLSSISKKLEKNLENLCDHDVYMECQYHNERYYYCRKCSWSN